MERVRWIVPALLLATAPVALGAPVLAAVAVAQSGITMEQAIRIALREVPGTVTEVEREGGAYEVEILDADRIEWKVVVRIRDGAVLRVEPD